jgi:hypothetical protein
MLALLCLSGPVLYIAKTSHMYVQQARHQIHAEVVITTARGINALLLVLIFLITGLIFLETLIQS